MKSFPQFPNGACDPERLNSPRQNQSRPVSAGQAAWAQLSSLQAPSQTQSQSYGRAPGKETNWRGVALAKGRSEQAQWRGREGGRSVIGNLGQEFLKAKYLGL